MLFLTTTAIDIDEEFLNRCLVLSVDEEKGQTQAIHKAQRFGRTVAGMLCGAEQGRIIDRHQNAQRLLRPLKVVNPFAESLSFADHATRTRRDHAKYLTLIDSIAFVHQYQRPLKTVTHAGDGIEYIEVEQRDIDLANKLGAALFSRSLTALPPQTRRLLGAIEEMSSRACKEHEISPADYRFTRRMVREHSHWGNTQLKVHLRRLTDLEYLIVHRGGLGSVTSTRWPLRWRAAPLAYQPPVPTTRSWVNWAGVVGRWSGVAGVVKVGLSLLNRTRIAKLGRLIREMHIRVEVVRAYRGQS